ncbi:hypothetical protein SCHPADRAFT_994554 [Schizopora paradoxa]|uniref:Rad51-like C-terminal domain-containing protein n=1 Tax=Schizopora paradoxa TaxID=27342 RepID=A0A0H2S048_9AGAM|nr:hypothetical protein SCHPADRAFT_994554 [Schizopora paradoxa]
MRLRTILREAPKELLKFLEENNVKTSEDFVFSSIEGLYQTLPPGLLSFADFEGLRDRVVKHLASEGTSGDTINAASILSTNSGMAQSRTFTNVTGHCELDVLLAAVTPGLIELAGGNDAEKTLLALNIALACLEYDSESLVYWIDTTGTFSADQALSILGKRLLAKTAQHGLSPESVLARLRVSLAFDLDSASTALEEIKHVHSDLWPRLVVIDSITSLLSSSLSSVTSQGHALMTIFMRSLQDVAANYSLIVLVLNKAASTQPPHSSPSVFAATKLKPALGPTFSFLTDTTLWLSRGADVLNIQAPNSRGHGSSLANTRGGDAAEELLIAEVLRSRSSTSRAWWPIVVKDGVLQERKAPRAYETDLMEADPQTQ